MRSYFKVFWHEGVFFENQPADWKTVENGGNDQVFAITMFGSGFGAHKKRNCVQFLNQLVPIVGTDPGAAIAVSYVGFEDYATYHELHPGG